MARLSQASYERREDAAHAIRREGWSLVKWIDVGPTEGFVAFRPGGEVVVAFRGTSERADVLTDLRAHKVDARPWWHSGRVHAGFAAAADLAWPSVEGALRTLGRDCGALSVWFTGHSLGGALATLMAARAFRAGRGILMGLVTFGCPRVGDRGFARSLGRALEGCVARYVNNSDIVPRLLWLTYVHVAATLYLTHRGALVHAPGFWWALWDRVLGRLSARLLNPFCWKTDGLRDHAIGAYRAALEATP